MAISYLVDVYKNKFPPASFTNFSLYLTFFPHLVAGPIVRYNEISKEIHSRQVTNEIFFEGITRFSIGLGKKVIIANTLGTVVDKIFNLPHSELTTILSWIGIIFYTFQIYFDFSGYSDMAIGLAKFFGFHFPENFNLPYISSSITEFWRRWHISLSSWFRDYLYIPLGGNRKGSFRTYLNLFIVFLLCGLWHGAAWTFIIWGIYHGLLLVIERFLKIKLNFEPKNIFFRFTTFILIIIGWVFFRSPSINFAISYLSKMFPVNPVWQATLSYRTINYYLPPNVIFFSVLATIFSFISIPKIKNATLQGLIAIIILIYAISFLSKTSFTPFIYFQF